MPTPHPLAGQEILFTQQHHFADRAGEHFDYRLVLGDKAYSWASRKDVPEPGKAIVLFEQPVHDRDYALSEVVEIPKGSYGSGVTRLKLVRKAKVEPETEGDKLVIKAGDERYLLKKLDPAKYGGGNPWLFKNLTPYKEGPNSTLTHDGHNYLVDDAIEQSKASKIEHLPVSKLAWMLEHGQATPERLLKADTRVPVLVTNWQDKVAVIDGFHRLSKAREEGLQTIPTRYVDTGKLKAYTRQKLASVYSVSQALDNSSEDFHFDHTSNKPVTDPVKRQSIYTDKIAKVSKSNGVEFKHGNVKVKRHGKDYLFEVNSDANDVKGRKSPLLMSAHRTDLDQIASHMHTAQQQASSYHSKFTGGSANFATKNLDSEVNEAIKGVNKLHSNRILKRVGIGGALLAGAAGLVYAHNKSAALSPELEAKFKPDFTPEQMKALGVLRHPGSKYNEEADNAPEKNFFGVRASLDAWPEKWHRPEHELGWYQWYSEYAKGKRTDDDERQIKRWLSFKARHLAQVIKADPSLEDSSIRPKQKQSLLNWGVAVGNTNKYLERLK